MKLELKESNSPFWIIGVTKNATLSGSNTNVPCYNKSSKKQKEIAEQILKNNEKVIEVYVITGTQWDNMPSGGKEELGYLKNKGKKILTRDEVTEGTYPKGVSRDPLPKNGVKVYTSPATALENKGDNDMELELKEDIAIDEKVITNYFEDILVNSNGWNIDSDGKPIAAGWYIRITSADFIYWFNYIGVGKEDLMNSDYDKLLNTLNTDNKYNVDNIATDILMTDGKEDIVRQDYINDLSVDTECKNKLKESKIVTPVGNPQTAGSFVNIDVDLDHMEVSDFIVRLSQAIRSEQTAILEYVALKSANGVTAVDREVVDRIIEEEKNHMVAITSLLYKQLKMNHLENIDVANAEFTLPQNGLLTDDDKLTESVNNVIDKILKEQSVTMSDEYFIGNREDGRMYHGLGKALDTIKDLITSTGDEIVIQNVTLNDKNSTKESVDITVNDSTSKNESIKETYDITVDVNYDTDSYNRMQVENTLINIAPSIKTSNYSLSNIQLNNKIFTCTLNINSNCNDEINEEYVTKIIDELFEKTSYGEYWIKRI